MKKNLYCLILAGGKGRRLWPESRVEMPKQFIDFFGSGRTQLQQTYDRFRHILPDERILVSTNEQYIGLVSEQLPSIPTENIITESIWRNTAPSIAMGTHAIAKRDDNAAVIVAPSDHEIIGIENFCADIEKALEWVSNEDKLLIMGIRPTRPEPGYGYIQIGDELAENIYHALSFTEKPERDFAQVFMDSGEFYWNTGLFMSSVETMKKCFENVMPSVDYDNISSFPNTPMERGVLEKIKNVAVMKGNFGWADMGSWHSIYEAERREMDDNVVLDSDVIMENSRNNIVKIPKGHLAVINGLNGYIVVEKGDTLLICPKKDSSALIRKYSAEVEIR